MIALVNINDPPRGYGVYYYLDALMRKVIKNAVLGAIRDKPLEWMYT